MRYRIWDVGVAVIALLSLIRIGCMLPGQVRELDFSHYYVSSRLLLEGKSPYVTPLAPLYEKYGFVYYPEISAATNPPLLLWLFAPFALLPPAAAFAAWAVVQAVCLGIVLWLTRHLLRGRLSVRGWWFVCALTVSSVPVYWHFGFSQVQLLLAALVLAAYDWQRAGKHDAACLAVTTAGLLKLFPFLLLPWFVWRGGTGLRGRLRRTAQTVAVVAVVVLVTGPKLWGDFFGHGTSLIARQIINRVSNFTVPSLLINLGYAAHDFGPGPAAARGWWIAGMAVGAGLVVAGYWLCLRRNADPEAEFCLLCIAMLTGSVTAWGHYFVFLIFPMAVAAARLAIRPTGAGVVLLGLCFLALDNLGFVAIDPWRIRCLENHIYWKILANHIPLYGLLGLGFFFVNELRSGARSFQPD